MKTTLKNIALVVFMLCIAACAVKKLTLEDKLNGDWTCDAKGTWALWNPGKTFTEDADFKALEQARLRLDLKNKKMVMWNERFGQPSAVESSFTIVSQTQDSVTIEDGDLFELRDAKTLFIHDPNNSQKGFIFKRK